MTFDPSQWCDLPNVHLINRLVSSFFSDQNKWHDLSCINPNNPLYVEYDEAYYDISDAVDSHAVANNLGLQWDALWNTLHTRYDAEYRYRSSICNVTDAILAVATSTNADALLRMTHDEIMVLAALGDQSALLLLTTAKMVEQGSITF